MQNLSTILEIKEMRVTIPVDNIRKESFSNTLVNYFATKLTKIEWLLTRIEHLRRQKYTTYGLPHEAVWKWQ